MAFDKRKALQSALSFTQQGKWDRAITEYQSILKVDPNDLIVCNNLGDLYARVGRVADAIDQYLKLGQFYRADGLSVKAIAVYKKIVKLDPTRTEAHLACADLYEEQGLSGEAKLQLATAVEHYARAGNTLKAIEVYQRLGQLDPANHVVLTKLADLMLREGMREAAATEYERAALAAQAAGQAAESKRLFQKVRELVPGSPHANLVLGEQYLREGRHAEAAEAFSKVTEGNPADARGWRLLGEAYLALAQASKAVTALERALELGLPGVEVWRPLAKALIQDGRIDEGVSLCFRLSERASSAGNPDEAVSICRDLLAVAPHLAPVHAHLIGILQELGRDTEARSAAHALAAAHVASGETEAAIHAYHQLLERDPSDLEAQRRLEELVPGRAAPEQPEQGLPIPVIEAAPTVAVVEEGGYAEGLPTDTVLMEETRIDALPTDTVLQEVPLTEVTPAEREEGESAPVEPAPAEAAPRVEEEPALDWEGPAPEEQQGLELSLEDAPVLNEPPPFQPERGFPLVAQAGQVFELDEFGELAGIRYSPQAPHGGALDRLGLGDGSQFGLPQDSRREEHPGSASSVEEEEALGEVAEQLAEAEVYLKYGLVEKARERLQEVARMAPDNLVARRRLKAMYLEGSQVDEACEEMLAIARIQWTHGQREGARREIQEGVSLAPDRQDLQELLADLSAMEDTSKAEQPRVVAMQESLPVEEPAFEVLESIAAPEILGLEGDIGPLDQPASGAETESQVTPGALADGGPEEAAALAAAPLEPAVPEDTGWGFPGDAEGSEASLSELSAEVGLESDVTLPAEEELPPEFDLLLEQPAEEPALVLEAAEGDLDQVMAEDLAEGEFYLSQGMVEEARVVHRRMEGRALLHPAAIQLGRQIGPSSDETPPHLPEETAVEPPPVGEETEAALAEVSEALGPVAAFGTDAGPSAEAVPFPAPAPAEASVGPVLHEASSTREPEETTPPSLMPAGPSFGEVTAETQPVGPPPPSQEQAAPHLEGPPPGTAEPAPTLLRSGGQASSGGFVNLGAELAMDLGSEEVDLAGSTGTHLIEDLLREFHRGKRQPRDQKDFETHYNLGNAYKDMDLFDEAIQEFRVAAQDPTRALACANLVGQCYVAKGEPEAAMREYRAGLEIRGHPREAYHGLRYNLGAASEMAGDLAGALEVFEILLGENPHFRDVEARVTALRARVHKAPVPSVPPMLLPEGEAPKRRKDVKKKISFI